MKLSFSTLGCPNWSFEKILDEAQAMGFDAIEIRGIEGQMDAAEIEYFRPGRQQDTRRQIRAHGLTLCGFGSSVSFHDPAKTEEMLSEGRRAIDVCHAMGIPYVRVFGNLIPENTTPEEAALRVAKGICALCDYAEGTQVGILLEVHGQFNTIETLRAVMDHVPSPRFGVLWDIAHSDKVYADNYLPFYQTIKPRLRHVHIKDHVRLPDGSFRLCHLGDGDIPIHDIVRTLLDDGYDGYLSLEWEKKWHPELPDCETEFPFFPAFMNG